MIRNAAPLTSTGHAERGNRLSAISGASSGIPNRPKEVRKHITLSDGNERYSAETACNSQKAHQYNIPASGFHQINIPPPCTGKMDVLLMQTALKANKTITVPVW